LWLETVKGPLEWYEAPGDHLNMVLQPNVDRVGEIIINYLNRLNGLEMSKNKSL